MSWNIKFGLASNLYEFCLLASICIVITIIIFINKRMHIKQVRCEGGKMLLTAFSFWIIGGVLAIFQ